MAETLCSTCGATTRIQDGYRICNQAGRRHGAVRVLGGGSGRPSGSLGWSIGLGLGGLGASAAVLTMLAVPCQEEPLIRAVVLGLGGLALGFGPAFGWRMWRPSILAWKRPVAIGLLALGSGALAGVLGFWQRTLPGTPGWAIAPVVVGWLGGYWAGVVPRSVVTEHAGSRLSRALKERLGRTRDRVACQVAECNHQGLTCPGNRCERRLCGTHWISQEGRCPGCGTRLVRSGRQVARLDWTPWLAGLGMTAGMAIALALGGPGHG